MLPRRICFCFIFQILSVRFLVAIKNCNNQTALEKRHNATLPYFYKQASTLLMLMTSHPMPMSVQGGSIIISVYRSWRRLFQKSVGAVVFRSPIYWVMAALPSSLSFTGYKRNVFGYRYDRVAPVFVKERCFGC